MPAPRLPRDIPRYAKVCLEAVAETGCGEAVSVGGAFGLAHYHEYRGTNDVDCWWEPEAGSQERARVIAAVQQALAREGRVGVRAWGDVTSVELAREGRVVFSFQVAARSGRLRPPFRGLWPGGVAVDSLEDLVASKMVALVNRGAPRDFRDIHAVVTAGLMDAMQCWSLWEERQRLSGEDADPGRARLAVRSHLARIEVARPLPSIADEAERARAADVRRWITTELLHEPAD